MKKIFIIGQINILFEKMGEFLSDFFEVHVWDREKFLEGGEIEAINADAILWSLLGLNEEKEDILKNLKKFYAQIPLVCLQVSENDIQQEMLEGISKSKVLLLPDHNEKVVEAVCEVLGHKYDKDSRVILENYYKKKCVLAIDDNALWLRMLNEMLKAEYDVMMANSAIKALTMIGKRVPDIILLDYDMPLCDGKMAMQMIREIEETKDVPIVFLTAVKDAAHIKSVLELHPAGYLLKPAKSDMIFEEIRKHIK